MADALGTEVRVKVQSLHIPVVGDVRELDIHHAQLLALIDIGRSLHGVGHGAQQLGALLAVDAAVGESAQRARLIVVRQIQAVPAPAVKSGLPLGHDLLELHEVPGDQIPLVPGAAVNGHVLELEQHIDLLPLVRYIQLRDFWGDIGCFTHGHSVVVRQHVIVELPQVLMDVGTILIETVRPHQTLYALHRGKTVHFGVEVQRVHTEAIHTLV